MGSMAAQIGISIALSYIAGRLLEPDDDSIFKDSKPTPSVERGAAIPLLLGREEIGATMLWSGGRHSKGESDPVGKGILGSELGQEQKIWFEEGWHGICVGPVRRLWRIRENGTTIFRGPIDPASHPSGTIIDLGKKGRFEINWGEQYQPVDQFLGQGARVGIFSRWPFLCHVIWHDKRLGSSPTWGRLVYEVEAWPYNTKLCASPSTFEGSRSTGAPGPHNILGVTNGAPGVNKIEIQTGHNGYRPGQYLLMTGQGAENNGDWIIDHVSRNKFGGTKFREIFLGGTTSTLSSFTGTVRPYIPRDDDGVNAAHVIYQLLFEDFPHGKGEPIELYDIDSLEELGVLVAEENLRTTTIAADYKTISSCIADLMIDIGFMFVYNESTGLIEFRPIREGAPVAVFTDDVLTGNPVEVVTTHLQEEPAGRKQFTFKQRSRRYSPQSIIIDDDGRSTIDSVVGAQRIDMTTVRDFTTASVIAKRRNQEDYSNQQRYSFTAHREARLLLPGQNFTLPNATPVLLCIEKDRKDTLSGNVEIIAIPNYYGITAANLDTFDGAEPPEEAEDSDEDFIVIPLEIPQQLTVPGEIRFGVGRIRAAADTLSAQIHLSPDDTTFNLLDEEAGTHTGGTLDDEWVGGPGFVDLGPIFTALGPDISTVLDLSASADKLAWQRGRQIAIVGDGTAAEIWFVRYIDALGGDSYQLREVLTGRFDTSKLTHASGAGIVIMDESQLRQMTDLSLIPDTSFYIKSQPVGNTSALLDDITSEQMDIYGKGLRPLPATALYGGGPNSRSGGGYRLGEDVTLRWGYRAAPGADNATSGAGAFPYGDALLQRAQFDGTCSFVVKNGSTVVRTVTGPLADFTLSDGTVGIIYTWAQQAADFSISMGFGGNINVFIEVSFIKGTLQSTIALLTLRSEGGTAP